MPLPKPKLTLAVKAVLALYLLVATVVVILVAVNYPTQWRLEANAERKRQLQTIAQALNYYYLDHDTSWPDWDFETVAISNSNDCQIFCPRLNTNLSCYNLQDMLQPSYLVKIPQEPLLTSDNDSGFYLRREHDTVTLGACRTYYDRTIEVPVSLEEAL